MEFVTFGTLTTTSKKSASRRRRLAEYNDMYKESDEKALIIRGEGLNVIISNSLFETNYLGSGRPVVCSGAIAFWDEPFCHELFNGDGEAQRNQLNLTNVSIRGNQDCIDGVLFFQDVKIMVQNWWVHDLICTKEISGSGRLE